MFQFSEFGELAVRRAPDLIASRILKPKKERPHPGRFEKIEVFLRESREARKNKEEK
jgi:hypothetical protein